MPFDRAITEVKEMIRSARTNNMNIRAGVQCAFGCVYEGKIPHERVLEIVRDYVSWGVDAIALSDTTGMANPLAVKQMLQILLPVSKEIPLVLHFHDTRGLGLANVIAALECGVSQFDTALAGMGGCPFVPGAAGNIATEDTAYLMESMGIKTGIDISGVAMCSQRLEKFLKKQLSGKIYRLMLQKGFKL